MGLFYFVKYVCMKSKFLKFLSLISSIVGIITICFGLSLSFISKPKTLGVKADDNPLVYSSRTTFDGYYSLLSSEQIDFNWCVSFSFSYSIDIVETTYHNYNVKLFNFDITNFSAFCMSTRGGPAGYLNNQTARSGSIDYFEFTTNNVDILNTNFYFNFIAQDDDYDLATTWGTIDRLIFRFGLDETGDEAEIVVSSPDIYFRTSSINYFPLFSNIHFEDEFILNDDINYYNGVQSVLNNPNFYNLYNEQQYISSFNDGINYVLDDPNSYNLYRAEQYLSYGESEFNRGFSYASDTDLTLSSFMRTLFHAPVDIFTGAINFSLPLGNGEELNLLPLMTFLLTISIGLAIVKLILGGK